jgi:hypothetical protein
MRKPSKLAEAVTLVRISARTPTILTKGFHGIRQSFQGNAEIEPQIRPRPLPPMSFLIQYSLITLPFGTVLSELLTACLKRL